MKINKHTARRSAWPLRTALISFTALTASSPALNAAAATGDAAGKSAVGLTEIVVTATRRTSNLQKTPIAVTAVDANMIAQLEPRTLADLAMMVPNFSANKINGFNAASFAMRGVGNTDIIVYNEAPVAVLIDDFVMPSVQTQLLDPFDVQEVEVLRGPQGTLFGKNTTGGAVIVKTKPPVLDQTSFEVQAGSGSYNAFTAHGALNIPLIDNQLALRVVASEDREDGWMRNGATTNLFGTIYHGDGRRVGGTDVFTGRAKLLWQPNDNFKALFTYEMLNDRSQTPGAVNTTPTASLPGAAAPYFVFANLGLPGYSGSDPAQEGVWVLSKDYETVFVNRRMTEMLGYSNSEMAGKTLFDFMDSREVPLAKDFLGKYKCGVSGNFEYELTKKDGSHIYASIAASQITDDKGDYLGTLALVADITLRKDMENKLEKYSKNLEEIINQKTKELERAQVQLLKSERLAAIGELSGMIGHDLRNPLTGIKNAAYFLKRKNFASSRKKKK